ncbi:MAG: hypothetical protein ACXVRI_06240 [Gaiellaceae bacterium]
MKEVDATRYAVGYFPSREGSVPSGHAFLLARDIPLGILPIRGTRDHSGFSVEVMPADSEREARLCHLLHIGQYEHHSLDEALIEFADTAANYIGYFGEVYFEIIFDAEGEPLQLDPLPPGRVVRVPGRYVQVIGKRDRNALGVSRFVPIPAERIWRLALPRSLGSARHHRRLLRRLERLSSRMPEFALQSPDLGRSAGFEFTAMRDASDRLQEQATRRWGTVPSVQRPVGTSTEYFFIARRLAFLQAQAKLREHMIARLNELLQRLDIPHSIAVSGIPTAADIATTLGQLHRGEVSFAEALDATRT